MGDWRFIMMWTRCRRYIIWYREFAEKLWRRVFASRQVRLLNKVANRKGLADCRDARMRLYNFGVDSVVEFGFNYSVKSTPTPNTLLVRVKESVLCAVMVCPPIEYSCS